MKQHDNRIFAVMLALVLFILIPSCEEPSFTILYNGNGNTGGSVPALGVTAPAGTMVTVSGNTAALSKTGYDFAGWNTQADGSGFPYQEGTSLIVPYGQAVTLYAQWRAKSYVVEFDTQGGTSSETSRTITFDQAYGTLPVPTKEGFRFLGWHTSTDESFARKVSSETIHREPGHIVLFAWWDDFIDAPYVVNHYFQDIATDSYELGLTRVLYATIGSEVQAELRRFEHFTVKENHPSHVASGVVSEAGDLELHLFYDRDRYTVTFDSQGGSAVPSVTVRYGDTIEADRPTRDGYRFEGWWTGAGKTGTQLTKDVPIAATMTVHAAWSPNPYVVTFNTAGGWDGDATVNADYGVAMPAARQPVRLGYVFGGYYDQPNGQGNQYYDEQMESAGYWDKNTSATLYASWTPSPIPNSAGGYVFYDKGAYDDTGWRYLEAAPSNRILANGPASKFVFGYYIPTQGESIEFVGTYELHGIGQGEPSTDMLVDAMGTTGYTQLDPLTATSEYAAKVCSDYALDVYGDWFLPTRDELNLIYERLSLQGVGDTMIEGDALYWSSEEWGAPSPSWSWAQDLFSGEQSHERRTTALRVWPVRAF